MEGDGTRWRVTVLPVGTAGPAHHASLLLPAGMPLRPPASDCYGARLHSVADGRVNDVPVGIPTGGGVH